MVKNKILVIDDSDQIHLSYDDFVITKISSDIDDYKKILDLNSDLICINRKLLGRSCWQVTRLIQSIFVNRLIPILIIAAVKKNHDKLKVQAMEIAGYFTSAELNRDLFNSYLKKNTLEKVSVQKKKDYKVDSLLKKLVEKHRIRDFIINNFFLELSLSFGSIQEGIEHLFKAISLVSKNDIIIIILQEKNATVQYANILESIKKKNYNDFIKFCYHNHFNDFSNVNIETIDDSYMAIDDLDKFSQYDFENKKINSYLYFPLHDYKGDLIGTVHLGNLLNNYFLNEHKRLRLEKFFIRAGKILGKQLAIKDAEVQKDNLKEIFSKFLPEKEIEKLIEAGDISRKGERKEIAILFSDIRSFTTISEKNSAEKVVAFLNNYFNIMVNCIKIEGGIIDKFIGDAIVAIFDVSEEGDNIAMRAVNAAVKMIASLSEVDTENLELPANGLSIGVGVHIGESVVGTVGSEEKMAYTSIGDVVTIAEELEGLTKKYKRLVLFSEQIKNKIVDKYNCEKIDSEIIEGKTISIYAVG